MPSDRPIHSAPPERVMVFSTPWFQVLESRPKGSALPQYAISSPDFVLVVPVTALGELVLVRQFRHALGDMTLELPAGHVDPGETPEESARKELVEETGYTADEFRLIRWLSLSPARFTNRMWCFLAKPARELSDGGELEAGMERVLYRQGVRALLREPEFCSGGSVAALMAAVADDALPL